MFDFIRSLFGRPQQDESSKAAAQFLRAAADAEPEREDEVRVIRACRDRFGPIPRSCRPEDQISVSAELKKVFVECKDDLLTILKNQKVLLTGGEVVWGHLVQANQMLFDPNNLTTCPANVIYSTDPFFDGRVSLLSGMARGLFAQKGSTKADREMQKFVDIITDEYVRVLRKEMPHSYTGERSVSFATCLIDPAHLPFGYLSRSSFPVIIKPKVTEIMMILPSRFWPEELVHQWRD